MMRFTKKLIVIVLQATHLSGGSHGTRKGCFHNAIICSFSCRFFSYIFVRYEFLNEKAYTATITTFPSPRRNEIVDGELNPLVTVLVSFAPRLEETLTCVVKKLFCFLGISSAQIVQGLCFPEEQWLEQLLAL